MTRKPLFILLLLLLNENSFAELKDNIPQDKKIIRANHNTTEDLAQTFSVISGITLRDFQIKNLRQLPQLVSGVNFSNLDPRRKTISIRGLKLDPDGGNDQPIQGYLDNIPLRTGEIFLPLYDVDRIELFKGVQGTLSEVNSIGGALYIYTKSPELSVEEDSSVASIIFANNNSSTVEAAKSFLFTNKFAMRFAGIADSNDGNKVKNIRNGLGESHEYISARMSFLWRPTSQLSVKYKYQKSDQSIIYPQPVAGSSGTPSYAERVNDFESNMRVAEFFGLVPEGTANNYANLTRPIEVDPIQPRDNVALHFQRPFYTNKFDFHDLKMNHTLLNHDITLNYSDSEGTQNTMIDRDYAGAYTYGYPQQVRTDTHIKFIDARLSSQYLKSISYELGYTLRDTQTYTSADLERSFSTYEFAPSILQPLIPFQYKTPKRACDLARKNPTVFADQLVVLTCMAIPVDAKMQSFFANIGLNITPKLFVQSGIKKQNIKTFTQQNLFLPLSALVKAEVGGGLTIPRVQPDDERTESTPLTGSFKVGYHISEDIFSYFTVETGFRRGGSTISPSPILPSLTKFKPEKTTMFETGIKGKFIDRKLTLNSSFYGYHINAFQSKWDDVTARIYNAGQDTKTEQVKGGIFTNNDVTIYGTDIEWKFMAASNVILGGGYSWNTDRYKNGSTGYANDPSYDGVAAATKDVSGEPLSDTAQSSLSFNIEVPYLISSGGEVYLRSSIALRGQRRSKAVNPDLDIKSLFLQDIVLGWKSTKQCEISVYAQNVKNDVDISEIQDYYSDYSLPGGNSEPSEFYVANTNRGKRVGISLLYNF